MQQAAAIAMTSGIAAPTARTFPNLWALPRSIHLDCVLVNQMLHIALDINRAKGRSFCP
jgi:hypothetical protein